MANISIAISDLTVSEGNSGTTKIANFRVSLSSPSTQTITVSYNTSNGTANTPSDYLGLSGILTFTPGQTTRAVPISIIGDNIIETNENFLINLSNATNAIISRSQGIGTIANDDFCVHRVTPVVSSITEGNSGQKLINYVITRTGNLALSTSVNYAVGGGVNASDYTFSNITGSGITFSNRTVNFAPNATTATISFNVLGDRIYELNENFTVSLWNPPTTVNYVSGPAATTIIANDDAIPTISINDISLTEGNSGTKIANFVVRLSNPTSFASTVNFTTTNQTATSGIDYTSKSGILTFSPNQTLTTIFVSIKGDTINEASETFGITLSNATNATIADSQGIGTILNDDSFNYGEALQKSFLFYEAQRSGTLPANNRIEWRGNSALGDGSDVGVNLTGGYYDAGDHVKFGFPLASAMTMLGWGVVEYRNGYQASGQLDEALSAIKWGTDYILKAHVTQQNKTKEFWIQVGDGNTDHSYWGKPENMTMARPAFKIDAQKPGSDVAGESAAALAAASMIFSPSDPGYASLLLQNAKQLFEFADTYRGKYSDSVPEAGQFYNSYSGYSDELVWSAIWLYKATGESSYLTKAENYYQSLIGGLGDWTQDWDNKAYGATVLLAETTKKSQYRTAAENWLNYWTIPGSGVTYTNGGLAWRGGWGSLRLAANTAFVAGVYSDKVNDYSDRYSNFSKKQIDYILGDNPNKFSYMVGFGDKYPLRPHHRASHGGSWATFDSSDPNLNILYGALVGGPKSANDYDYQDIRTDYVANEVSLDYNAGLTGALARLYGDFGGQPLTDAQLDALPGIKIVNNPSPPSITIDDFSLTEGNSGTKTASFLVRLSASSSSTVTVNFATVNQTALLGSDYTATSGVLTFSPNQTVKSILVSVIGDTAVEANETFGITLSNATNATLADSQGVGTISNDDIVSSNLNYGEALQKSFLFYEAQRSGKLPANNRIEWRGNSALGDGSDVGLNLTGGYYDAGDRVKFGFPMASAMTMLGWGVVAYRNAYQTSGQLDEVLSAIKWGTDYILKVHITQQNKTKEFWVQVGDGNVDHSYWGKPENMTMARPAFKIDAQKPGSDVAGESAAALAAASIAFAPSDPTYANVLVQNAKQLFEFADTYRGKYSDSVPQAGQFYNSYSGYNDELVWGAIWLYKATGETSYLTKAENYYQSLLGGLSNWTQDWDSKSYGAAVLLAEVTKKSQYRTDVENWLNRWSIPGSGVAYTPGGLAWGGQWGSLRYAANTAFVAGVYSDKVNDYSDRYSNFSKKQIDYILGDNPNKFSYMVGFGDKYPLRPHHAAAHGGSWDNFNNSDPNPNILYGALVGGPKSANDYDYQDVRTDYIGNEVTLDYNAGLTGALARLYSDFGGQPLTDSQLDALPGIVINSAV